ncbi:hypothetical protein OIDMADRAFT_16331 [Oidiodendron maius Zn]|uniref:Acid phosphatase-like protein n=1 Tax=Oidiodendron maius (strain Zn) TaxID=913774 RepID=A0A0C3E0F2_OIDMZ|nr:hypothetical protein OIDMADRAFT_16331 [Oidiodendron maius Zn]
MGFPGVAAFFIIVAFIVACIAAWIAYTHIRARRLGLPRPTLSSYNPFGSSSHSYGGPQPAPGGIRGWFSDKFRAFKNRNNRTAGGAYEENLSSNIRGGRGTTRGFGPLDPDDAWDAHVGTEADGYGPHGYEEEQELGLHPSGIAPTPIGVPPAYEEERGRALNRAPESHNRGYEEAGSRPSQNPFDDSADPSNVSLRGVSPRPVGDSRSQGHLKGQDSIDSQTERRSLFREEV